MSNGDGAPQVDVQREVGGCFVYAMASVAAAMLATLIGWFVYIVQGFGTAPTLSICLGLGVFVLFEAALWGSYRQRAMRPVVQPGPSVPLVAASPSDEQAASAGHAIVQGCGVVFFLAVAAAFLYGASQSLLVMRQSGQAPGMVGIELLCALIPAVAAVISIQNLLHPRRVRKQREAGDFLRGADAHPNFPRAPRGRRDQGGIIRLGVDQTAWVHAARTGIVGVLIVGTIAVSCATSWTTVTSSGGSAVLFIVAVGIYGIVCLGQAAWWLFRATTIGDGCLEVSAEPARPGQSLSISYRPQGSFSVQTGRLSLICREWVQYTEGTTTFTAVEVVHEEVLTAGDGLTATSGQPLLAATCLIPPDAMHSWRAEKNHIEWGLKVDLEISGRPDVHDFYAFRVAP